MEVCGKITAAAIASFDGCPNPRTRALLQSLTAHLHAFVAETRLTRAEWEQAIEILTETGGSRTITARSSFSGRTSWESRCWSMRSR